MKALPILLTTSLFAASVSADSIYHGFGAGNGDLVPLQTSETREMTGVQPGVGDSRGSGSGTGGEDRLFRGSPAATKAPASWDIYNGFESPDL